MILIAMDSSRNEIKRALQRMMLAGMLGTLLGLVWRHKNSGVSPVLICFLLSAIGILSLSLQTKMVRMFLNLLAECLCFAIAVGEHYVLPWSDTAQMPAGIRSHMRPIFWFAAIIFPILCEVDRITGDFAKTASHRLRQGYQGF